ncbi:hypothetical protein [Streptomyces agglomeratus]|uniref:hypothetical protein n=1 Tax=Streptomyces agglomeratus TaxID=285458 RepID=UPI00114D1946|nr:hypothetical protein [Streptomyces agglomeratus]
MNIVRKMTLGDSELIDTIREHPISMRSVLQLLGLNCEPPRKNAPTGFMPVEEAWLDRAELFILPIDDFEGSAEVVHQEPEPKSRVWLEGRYLDEGHKEVVVFPNEADTDHTRLILFARQGGNPPAGGNPEDAGRYEEQQEPPRDEPANANRGTMTAISVEIAGEVCHGPYELIQDEDCFFNSDGHCTSAPGSDYRCHAIVWAGNVLAKECLRLVEQGK